MEQTVNTNAGPAQAAPQTPTPPAPAARMEDPEFKLPDYGLVSASDEPGDSAQPEPRGGEDEDQADPASSGDLEGSTDEGRDDLEASRPKSRSELRIAQLTKQRNEALAELEHYRSLHEKAVEAKEAAAADAPNPMDFTDDAAYFAAVARHAAEQAARGVLGDMKKSEAERLEKAAEKAAERVAKASQEVWNERVEGVKEALPDFEKVVYESDKIFSESTVRMLHQMPDGPAIAFYLAKNPAISLELSRLSPMEQAMELGSLSQRLKGAMTKRQSKAPEPVKTVSGKAAGVSVRADQMNQADFNKWMQATEGMH